MRSPFALALLATVVLSPMFACGAEDAGSTEDDLTQAAKKLVGEYVEQGTGALRGLVLTSEKATSGSNRFFADIDTGIQCVKAPCPTSERVEGTFSAGTKTITLKSADASDLVAPFLGKYDYKLKSGKLSLTRKGETQSLEVVPSYCSSETVTEDCERTAKDMVFPACVGTFTCSATNQCGWKCGVASKECGGFAGLTCSDEEYCAYEPAAQCGAADQTGTCKPRPDSCAVGCPAPEFQVCACDGQKYCNECEAQSHGVDVTECDSTGPKTCGGLAGFMCDDDEFCDYEPAAKCGIADQTGVCKKRPTDCPLGCPAPQFQKCGCDGELYCNECEAQSAGVDVSGKTGTCN